MNQASAVRRANGKLQKGDKGQEQGQVCHQWPWRVTGVERVEGLRSAGGGPEEPAQ